MPKKFFEAIALFLTIAILAGYGGETKPVQVKQTSEQRQKEQPSTEVDAVRKIARYFSIKEYTGNNKYYTSKDFREPEEISKAIQVISISDKSFSYISLLRAEILARNNYDFKQEVYQKIFNFTTWYDQSKKGEYSEKKLTDFEKENLDRLNNIEKEGYSLDYFDEVSDEELAKIKKEIDADMLKKVGKYYSVAFYWPNGIGIDNTPVEWKTNMLYIGEIKMLSREGVRKDLYNQRILVALKEEKQKGMDAYKEETKKVYEERMKSVQNKLSKIEEYEKLGGPLIPQGTVIFNDTGKEIKPRITSYASPEWIGVYAPSDEYQEGQQALYSYDASAFGHMALISKKYVELGTPRGQAIFNAEEGFLEYVASLPYIYKLDKKGNVIYDTLNNTNKINEKIPEYFGEPMRGMNYDITHDLSWGVDVDRNFYSKWYNGAWYAYSIYSNLNWYSGYRYGNTEYCKKAADLIKTEMWLNINTDRFHYGAMLVISNDVYLGNVKLIGTNNLSYKLIYVYVDNYNVLNNSQIDKLDKLIEKNSGKFKEYYVKVKGNRYYSGVPSFFGLPYAYDWSLNPDKEGNLWIDIYPIQNDKVLRRIWVKDMKIGEKIKAFIEKTNTKRILEKIPQVKYIRFISDDINGLIYFDVKLDIELYDFAPLIMAVDREGNLKLLARLWSAAGDKEAIKGSAKMGPYFYDYRAVLLANGDIFTIWNGSKGIGIGKLEYGK